MKSQFWIVNAMVFAIFVIGQSTVQSDEKSELTDARIKERLIGKWYGEEGGGKVKGTTEYKNDGTFEGEASLEVGDQKLKIEVSGKWKVSEGHIVATVESSNPPGAIPPGRTTKDQVLSIDEKELKYKTEKGKVSVRKRVKEQE